MQQRPCSARVCFPGHPLDRSGFRFFGKFGTLRVHILPFRMVGDLPDLVKLVFDEISKWICMVLFVEAEITQFFTEKLQYFIENLVDTSKIRKNNQKSMKIQVFLGFLGAFKGPCTSCWQRSESGMQAWRLPNIRRWAVGTRVRSKGQGHCQGLPRYRL